MRAGRSHFTNYALLAEEILNILLLYCLSIIKLLHIHSLVNNQLYLRCYTLMAAPPKICRKIITESPQAASPKVFSAPRKMNNKRKGEGKGKGRQRRSRSRQTNNNPGRKQRERGKTSTNSFLSKLPPLTSLPTYFPKNPKSPHDIFLQRKVS